MKRRDPSNWPYPRHPYGPRDPIFRGYPQFERHIFLYRDQLMLDVESQIGVIAKTRKSDETESLENVVDNYKPLLNRWIDKYINLAKGRMSAFLLERFTPNMGDELKNEDEIDIELQMNDDWDDTCFAPLVQSVHDYVVNGVIYELLMLLLPPRENMVNVKQGDVDKSYADIKRYVCATKPGRIHKPLQPF